MKSNFYFKGALYSAEERATFISQATLHPAEKIVTFKVHIIRHIILS